jgi:hypothetical protein
MLPGREVGARQPLLRMKTDGNGRDTPLPFLLPYFFIGNGSGTRTARNGMGTGIDGYIKMNKYEHEYNGNGAGTENLHRNNTLQDIDIS